MKVPYSPVGMTQPSQRSQGYLQDASGAAASGLSQLTSAIGGLGAALQQQQDSVQRFGAMQKWDESQQKLNESTSEFFRSADPADTTIMQRAEVMYDNHVNKTISELPPALQEQYKAQAAAQKTQFLAGTLKFDYEAKDGWFRQGVKDKLVQAQVAVAEDWSTASVDARRKEVQDRIDSSNLSTPEKIELRRNTDLALLQEQYRQAKLHGTLDGKPIGEPEKKGHQSKSATGAKLSPKASGDRGKQLAFAFHELNTTESRAGGLLKSAKTIDQAVDAGLAFERPSIPARGARIRNARLVLEGKATPAAMQARAYFESQGLTPVQASGFVGTLMGESGQHLDPGAYNPNDPGGSLGIGQWNGPRKKAMLEFTGASGDITLPDGSSVASIPANSWQSSIDDDPRFASLPLEFREGVTQDMLQMRRQQQAAAEQQAKDERNSFINDYQISILQGKKGKAEIDGDLFEGRIDYKEHQSLMENYDKRNKADEKLNEGLSLLGKGLPPSGAQFDAVANHVGAVDGILGGSPEAVDWAAAQARSVHDIAPSIRDAMISMYAGSDPAKAVFGMKAIQGIQTADELAFQKFPETVQNNVALFKQLTGSGMSDLDAMQKIIGPSLTPDEQLKVREARKTAGEMFSDPSVKGDALAEKTMKSLMDLPGLGTGDAQFAPTGYEQSAFRSWYKTWWTENYTKLGGDAAKATAATDELAAQQWTVSNAGGLPTLMRWAPESIGLPKFQGSYAWMGKQVEQQLQLPPGSKFQLIADEQTRTEIANWQAGGMKQDSMMRIAKDGINWLAGREVLRPDAPAPSWRVLVIGADGIPRMDESTNRRARLTATQDMHEREAAEVDHSQLEARLVEVGREWRNEQEQASRESRAPDPIIEQNYQRLLEEYDASQKQLYPEASPQEYTSRRGNTPQKKYVPPRAPTRVPTSGPPNRDPINTKGFTEPQISAAMRFYVVPRDEAIKILRNREPLRVK